MNLIKSIKKNRFFKTLKKLAVNRDYIAIKILCRANAGKYQKVGRIHRIAASCIYAQTGILQNLEAIKTKGTASYEYEVALPDYQERYTRYDDQLLATLKDC